MRREEITIGQTVCHVYRSWTGNFECRIGEVVRFTPTGRVSVRFESGKCSALLPFYLDPCELVKTAWGTMPVGPEM